MALQAKEYRPVELIFNLLSACRRGAGLSLAALRLAVQRRGLQAGPLQDLPRLPFWIRLCQAAALLDEGTPAYPTVFAADWLAWPLDEQLARLVRAWQASPAQPRLQVLRQRILDRLYAGAPLNPTGQRELGGLQALGVCEGDRLSALGRSVLAGEMGQRSFRPASEPWRVTNDRLLVPFPPDWGLLWELEAYLDPLESGVYALTPQALRLAAQRGALEGPHHLALPGILERGLGRPAAPELLRRLGAQPTIRVLPGPVLEFSDPAELVRLRQSPAMRRELGGLLSPRHIQLDPWQAPRVLRRLYRSGALSERDLDPAGLIAMAREQQAGEKSEGGTRPSNARFGRADRLYLLVLLLLAEGLSIPFAPPPGLLVKLSAGLDDPTCAAAANKASQALAELFPLPGWVPEEEPPPAPEGELIAALQQAIERGETLDVHYQASGRPAPELRHLSPLLLEQRGLRYYLLAYCHTRRANRIFRVDRLRIVQSPFAV